MTAHILDEDRLRFSFKPTWSVARYDGDKPGGAAFYRNKVVQLPGTKAVDFVGVWEKKDGFLIEVKDFRGYRIQNKKRLRSEELALEVAQKVRDTVAGLVGAARNAATSEALVAVGLGLPDSRRSLLVVLWLEDDAQVDPRAWAEELNTLTTRLQGYLQWLTRRILVVSMSTHREKPPDVSVQNVPGT